jgi:enoyl-CoA hydratase
VIRPDPAFVRDATGGDAVRVEIESGIAVLTLDRPPVNALSAAAYASLGRAASQIAADETVRVAILTAAGRMFCAGADVKELRAQTPAERAAFFELTSDTRRKVAGIPIPVIAALNGPAVGAGVAYASYCDYRIAADDAFLAMPEIDLGSVAAGGVALMAIGVPPGALRYLLYAARRIPAAEAATIHLVDEVVPADRLMTVARERASAIAAKPRSALVAMKRAIGEMSRNPAWSEAALVRTQQMTIDAMAQWEASESTAENG